MLWLGALRYDCGVAFFADPTLRPDPDRLRRLSPANPTTATANNAALPNVHAPKYALHAELLRAIEVNLCRARTCYQHKWDRPRPQRRLELAREDIKYLQTAAVFIVCWRARQRSVRLTFRIRPATADLDWAEHHLPRRNLH